MRQERGAVALIVAASSALLVAMAAFCVDLGMQRVVRSDMQSVADVVALDMARQLGVSSGAPAGAVGDGWATALQAAIDSQSSTLGHSPAATPAGWTCNADLCAKATPGWADANGLFTTAKPASVAAYEAVKVETTAVVDFSFRPGSGTATRTAIARTSQPAVCFSAGTTLLALDTTKSALSPLLDHILKVDLKAVSYSGIVDTKDVSVPLAALAAQLHVGTVAELLATKVSVSQLAVVLANAVKAGDPTADVSVLQSLRLGVSDLTLPLGQILNVSTGGSSAGLAGDVNVFQLLTARILLADVDHAIDASVVVPTVTGVSLQVITPPKIACGSPTDNPKPVATEAQIQLHVEVGPLDVPGLVGASINLNVQVGAGTATLNGLSCSPESATLDLTTGAVAVPSLPPVDPSAPRLVRLKLLGLPIVGSLYVDVNAAATIASSSFPAEEIRYAPQPAPLPGRSVSGSQHLLQLTVPTGGVAITAGQDGLLSLINALLGGVNALLSSVLDTVVGLVSGPVSTLLNGLVQPLLTALGIELGTTEVHMLSRPACAGVRLTH